MAVAVPKLWLLRCPFPSHRALLVRLGPEEQRINRRGVEGRLKPDFPIK